MRTARTLLVALSLVSLLLAGCGSADPTPAPRAEPVEATATPIPATATPRPRATSTSELQPTATPTTPSSPTSEPTAAPAPPAPRVASNANLRAGPGVNYDIAGSAAAGDVVEVVASDPSGDWYLLANGAWIAAFLIADAPAGLPVATVPAPPTAVPQRAAPAVPLATATSAPQPQVAVCQCSGVDYDCGNFSSWSAAEACFSYCLQTVGYDVHRLDRDNDGIACESMQ